MSYDNSNAEEVLAQERVNQLRNYYIETNDREANAEDADDKQNETVIMKLCVQNSYKLKNRANSNQPP